MKISRDNYEIWLTDWLDNKLTGEQAKELDLFLEQNPDLRSEFTDFCMIGLKPVNSSFNRKDNLKKSVEEISQNQFEILCAASLENDLDPDHEAELVEMVSANPERYKTLRIFRKLRLKAPEVQFSAKGRLYRSTPSRKVIRLVLAGLSAAALITFFFLQGRLWQQDPGEIRAIIASENSVANPQVFSSDNESKKSKAVAADITSSKTAEVAETKTAVNSENKDTSVQPRKDIDNVPEKITYSIEPAISFDKPSDNTLIAMVTLSKPDFPENDEHRSNIGRFIAGKFRSNILRETTPSDAPLKGYEIAEAGIDGLNKLLGWEMALTRNTDENGDLKSLNFNSRMLKFKAPVKNNQPTE